MANPEQEQRIARQREELAPETLLAQLEAAVGRLQDSEGFQRYLEVQARFHQYSWGNILLILAQRPDATRVAGYQTWRRLNRYVRRGERGIRIIVPRRWRERVVNEAGEVVEVERLAFGIGTVFDISQTEGEPLPEVAVPVLEGEEGRELYSGLAELARSEGLRVGRSGTDLPEGALGMYLPDQKEILVREAAPRQMAKTLAHELAHHFARPEGARSRGEQECIAEAVAYVVCRHGGLDTGERSFPYIALWSRDKAVLKGVLATIQQVSARIIDGLEKMPPTKRSNR